MLRNHLYGMPTWPVLISGPIVMIVVLGLHYSDRYSSCTRQADFRDNFVQQIIRQASDDEDVIDLTTIINFNWDSLEIMNSYQPSLKTIPSCPFGWDWSDDELQQIIEEERLTMLVFLTSGSVVKYLKLDRHKIFFNDVKQRYTISDAQFKIRPSNTGLLIVNDSD